MAVLTVRWQCLVLLTAGIVVLCLHLFTNILDEDTIARFSVDGVAWDQRLDQRHAEQRKAREEEAKMTDEEKEAAGLGKSVHTFHDDSGNIMVTNTIGSKTLGEHNEHTDRKKHLQGPPLPKYMFDGHQMPEAPPPEKLLSEHKLVEASVRGNLGPAGAVTDSKNVDWLKDRWQAAKDMSGTPIGLPQWLIVDLEKQCQITRFHLDWETAFASGYKVELSDDKTSWRLAYQTDSAPNNVVSPKHVVHDFLLGGPEQIDNHGAPGQQEKLSDDVDANKQGRYVRLTMEKAGTGWGVSLWEMRVFGFEL